MVIKRKRFGQFQLTEGKTRTGKKIFFVARLPSFSVLKVFRKKSIAIKFIKKRNKR